MILFIINQYIGTILTNSDSIPIIHKPQKNMQNSIQNYWNNNKQS